MEALLYPVDPWLRVRHKSPLVHDAVLIAAPVANVAGMQAAMAQASRIVLAGFEPSNRGRGCQVAEPLHGRQTRHR
jgi:hypothetical protein